MEAISPHQPITSKTNRSADYNNKVNAVGYVARDYGQRTPPFLPGRTCGDKFALDRSPLEPIRRDCERVARLWSSSRSWVCADGLRATQINTAAAATRRRSKKLLTRHLQNTELRTSRAPFRCRHSRVVCVQVEDESYRADAVSFTRDWQTAGGNRLLTPVPARKRGRFYAARWWALRRKQWMFPPRQLERGRVRSSLGLELAGTCELLPLGIKRATKLISIPRNIKGMCLRITEAAVLGLALIVNMLPECSPIEQEPGREVWLLLLAYPGIGDGRSGA